MPASEYGSYYWCVVLKEKESNASGETVYLHADSVDIDDNGALTFKSAGRRPAGAEPGKQGEKSNDNGENGERFEQRDNEKEKDKKDGTQGDGMIYVAFAPGSWKVMYAAKLRDGSPASIEHWNAADGSAGVAPVTQDAGAAGFGARE
jgi:hypothetical protein